MPEDYQEHHRKKLARVRSITDFVMGSLLFLVGLYFLTYEKLDMNIFNREHSSIDYLIGGMFVLYGAWRIYRGYKKDYFS